MALRTFPARARATASCSGVRTTSMPGSGSEMGAASVRAQNRCMYSSVNPGETIDAAQERDLGVSVAGLLQQLAPGTRQGVLALDIEEPRRDLGQIGAHGRTELTHEHDIARGRDRDDGDGVVLADQLVGTDVRPVLDDDVQIRARPDLAGCGRLGHDPAPSSTGTRATRRVAATGASWQRRRTRGTAGAGASGASAAPGGTARRRRTDDRAAR